MGLGVCDYERSAAINVHPSVTFLIQGASDTMLFCNPEAQRELLDWGKVFFFFFPDRGKVLMVQWKSIHSELQLGK